MPFRLLLIWIAALAAAVPALAADQHPWISSPLRVPEPESYFSNLHDGDRIETPFVARFGLSRSGLAPSGDASPPHTGHHHLLVNRDLPLDFTKPLPFNDQYIHFGKGQMETVLTFKPGVYHLRLLLADHKHIPQFIYSKPLTITVTRHNDKVDPKSLVHPGVAILEPASGVPQHPPFAVRLHASGFNVNHVAVRGKGAGHFCLVAERPGAAPERIELTNGATEVWLAPPPGSYKLRVELQSNSTDKVLASSAPIDLQVGAPVAAKLVRASIP